MRRSLEIAALILVVLGTAACSSSSKSSSTTSSSSTTAGSSKSPTTTANVTVARKTAYCAANESIDKAGASVNSNAGFLLVLKSHPAQLQALLTNAPAGAVGQATRATVNAARRAIASNNANLLNNIPNGAAVDTYCGVNGNGAALPSYFATGKETKFCKGFLPIFKAVGNANGPTDVLKVILSYKAQVAQLARQAPSLPSAIRAKARATVKTAQTAIAQNSAASLKQGGNGPAQYVALYCGQNE